MNPLRQTLALDSLDQVSVIQYLEEEFLQKTTRRLQGHCRLRGVKKSRSLRRSVRTSRTPVFPDDLAMNLRM